MELYETSVREYHYYQDRLYNIVIDSLELTNAKLVLFRQKYGGANPNGKALLHLVVATASDDSDENQTLLENDVKAISIASDASAAPLADGTLGGMTSGTTGRGFEGFA